MEEFSSVITSAGAETAAEGWKREAEGAYRLDAGAGKDYNAWESDEVFGSSLRASRGISPTGVDIKMKVMLIGCGAVGIGFATALYQGGERPVLVARGETGRIIAEQGIGRTGLLGDVTVPADRVRVSESPAAAGETGFDFVLIAAKTTGSEALAAELGAVRNLLKPDGRIVLLQNGLGNENAYLKYFSREQVCFAYICIGFQKAALNRTEITVYSGPAGIGSLTGDESALLSPLAAAISAGGIPTQVREDIEKLLWAKMLYNCTLNPLGAVLRVPYGKLAESGDATQIMNRLIEEIFGVMKAAGCSTFWPDAKAYQKEFYETILPPTYEHRSSTLQDVERKVKTEIDSLNGYIVRLGDRYGADVACNRMLCSLIGAIEDSYE